MGGWGDREMGSWGVGEIGGWEKGRWAKKSPQFPKSLSPYLKYRQEEIKCSDFDIVS
jgi:hypothetical protein